YGVTWTMVERSKIVGFSLLVISALGVWAMLRWFVSDSDGQPANDPTEQDIELAVVARGFRQVTDIQFVPGSHDRAVVLVKDCTPLSVSLLNQRVVTATDFPIVFRFDVLTASELGLFGIVFHPKY